MIRSRYLVTVVSAAVFLASVSVWSCAHVETLSVMDVDLQLLRDSIVASLPHDSMFDADPSYSDTGVVAGIITKTRGIIQPHKTAHTGTLTHRKVLARIRVDRPYRQLAASPADTTYWNYWVAAFLKPNGSRSNQWVSVYVAPDVPNHIKTMKLTGALSPVPHTRAMAKWRRSKAVPWASCSANMCCCEDSECRTPLSAHQILVAD
jgi:hypothetical protein